ncbi:MULTISPECIES: CsbD family protein [unclassified Ornithinimicrobium]|uniref:CsbD family protein n=1 Tax=unclassified Ornithinimicrobium TaxID=2615080 RepID=UPI0038526DB0
MGLGDKISNAAEDAKGKAKEGFGDATDNERMEAEGRAEQAEAEAKKAGENVKDAFKDATGN